MPELVLKNPLVKIGTSGSPSTDLWRFVNQLTITYSAELIEKTASGDSFRSRLAGLKDWSIAIDWNQDHANSLVDDEMWALVGIGSTGCWIEVRATTATVGAGNPRYYGNALLESYSPIAGSIGELASVPTNFMGDGNITRAES